MQTRAVRDGDHFILNGVKRWITNAGLSEFYTVFVVTDPDARSKGISAFVVEKSDDGVSFGAPEKKLGIKGSPTCEVYSRRRPHPRATDDRRRVEPASRPAMRTLDHTRVTIAAQAVGIAQGALDYALGYVKERKQFGKALAEFQGLQFMLADMGMKLGGRTPAHLRRGSQVRARRRRPAPSSALPRSASPPTWRWRSPPMRCSSSAATATPRTSRLSA